LGIARAHVAGLATGGFIAQLLALDHPSRVASLVLMGTRPVAPGPVDDELPEHSAAVMAHFGTAPPVDWTDRTSILDAAVATAECFPARHRSTRPRPAFTRPASSTAALRIPHRRATV
jgi:pimeloyl-ACP methyl ester carboxylesterase